MPTPHPLPHNGIHSDNINESVHSGLTGGLGRYWSVRRFVQVAARGIDPSAGHNVGRRALGLAHDFTRI